jgi:DNA-binding transcriptional LysR family regulator
MTGLVSVTSLGALARQVFVPCFAALHRKHPDIQVDLLPETTQVSLSMRETDIAVRLTRTEQKDLVVRRIGQMAFGLYANQAYLDRHDGIAFEDGCVGHCLVTHLNDRQNVLQSGWLSCLAPRARIVLRSNSYQTQLEAAAAGEGLACLPRFYADKDNRLRRLRAPAAEPVEEIWLVVHADNRNLARIRVVLDAIAQSVRRYAGSLLPSEETLCVEQAVAT